MSDTSIPSAEAIRELQRTAVASAGLKTFTIECEDGAGGKQAFPVAVLLDGDGKMKLHPMLDLVVGGENAARAWRLEKAAGPDRRYGTAHHQSLASFIDHANRFKADNSVVWADGAGRKLVSVLDYHLAGAEGGARWGRHRGVYPCPLSEAWTGWGGGKEFALAQDEFAALLDSRDRELVAGTLPNGKQAPDPAALITLAANLEVYSTATARRERDPNTGRLKIAYTEEKGVSGTISPPPSFLVLIPVFQDSAPQMLEVRLRVTVEEGAAKFAVQIHAASDVLRRSFQDICVKVAEDTGIPLFDGSPET